jgi:hypothetical protein
MYSTFIILYSTIIVYLKFIILETQIIHEGLIQYKNNSKKVYQFIKLIEKTAQLAPQPITIYKNYNQEHYLIPRFRVTVPQTRLIDSCNSRKN